MEEQKQVHPHIVPTVGRVVWYWSTLDGADDCDFSDPRQPMRADICHVNHDGTVNLSVNDHFCTPRAMRGITLHQGDAAGCSLPRPFATWMPYQNGHAAKSDQLKADLLDLCQTALEAAQEALEDETNRLQLDMLREQVRQIRLQNDAFEADMRGTPPADRTPEVPGMPPHQVRMRFERDELSVRLMKLRNFTAGREFAELDETEQELMHDQAEAMQRYLACLQDQIALFNEQQDAA